MDSDELLTHERRTAERRFIARIDAARVMVVDGRMSPNTAQRQQLAALADLQRDDLVTGEIVDSRQLPQPSYSRAETPRRAVRRYRQLAEEQLRQDWISPASRRYLESAEARRARNVRAKRTSARNSEESLAQQTQY